MSSFSWEEILARLLQFLPLLFPLLKWYRDRKGARKAERFMNGMTVAYLELAKELKKGQRMTRKFVEDAMRKGLEKQEDRGVVRVRMGG